VGIFGCLTFTFFVIFGYFLILCSYRATMEVSSSDEELIHQSTSEFDRYTVGKDRGFADGYP